MEILKRRRLIQTALIISDLRNFKYSNIWTYFWLFLNFGNKIKKLSLKNKEKNVNVLKIFINIVVNVKFKLNLGLYYISKITF